MGRHSKPEAYSDIDTREFPGITGETVVDRLKISPTYLDGPKYAADPHEFETWWEDYVTAPIEAANPVETKVIPLANLTEEDLKPQWSDIADMRRTTAAVIADRPDGWWNDYGKVPNPPTTGIWEPPSYLQSEEVYGSSNDVDLWKIFSYIIMIVLAVTVVCLVAMVALSLVVSALAVAFVAVALAKAVSK